MTMHGQNHIKVIKAVRIFTNFHWSCHAGFGPASMLLSCYGNYVISRVIDHAAPFC